MELSNAYNEIHRLLDETNAQREAFAEVANKLKEEMLIVCKILRGFSTTFEYEYCGTERFIKNNLFPLGEKEIRFEHNSIESKRLTGMKKEELEKLVNLYSPEELEIIEIYYNTRSSDTTVVKVKLKAFKW